MNELIIKNSDGAVIESVYQWDNNREITISGVTLSNSCIYTVQFANCKIRMAYVITAQLGEAGLKATIPLAILESCLPFSVFVCEENTGTGELRTVGSANMTVVRRIKPDGRTSAQDNDIIAVADGLVADNGLIYLSKGGEKFGSGVVMGGGGAQVGSAVPVLHGTTLTRIGSWDYPLLQGTLGTPINGMIGGLAGDAISWELTPESSYYSIRALIPELYRIPAGKTATVSVSGNDIGIFGIYCTKDQIITERTGAVQASPAVFSNTSEDDIYFVPRFCIASDDSAQITPSDVGTVMAVLE